MKATEVTAGLVESNGSLLPGQWRDSLHVTCGLTACTPGSAPGPTLGNEHGKTLPLLYFEPRFFTPWLNATCAWWGFIRQQTIVTASKPLSVEDIGLDSIRWLGQLQRSSGGLMTCCSAEFRTPPTTFYMSYQVYTAHLRINHAVCIHGWESICGL